MRLAYLIDVERIATYKTRFLTRYREVMSFLPQELRVFIIHMRLHYMILLFSSGYLFAGLFLKKPDWISFFMQYVNVVILLFGTATVYNSWHDRDEGPIGGLKHPPKMQPWMRKAALWLQFVGLLWAHYAGMGFTYLYLVSMILFWLYSSPRFRWKAHPILSLVAIAFSTGTNSFWMGYLAGDAARFPLTVLAAGLGVAALLLALYPVSQLFQLQSDQARGDQTFALAFGIDKVKQFFTVCYVSGLALAGLALTYQLWWMGLFLIVSGSASGYLMYQRIQALRGIPEEYESVMQIKYLTAASFFAFIVVGMVLIHVILI
jgi:1,4-dihydroxy-2-naphthoate octaprenyltransferase